SGALMFCGDLAVGIVRTVDSEWDRSLTATPVQHLLEDDAFKMYWAAQNLILPAVHDVFRFSPGRIESTLLERISSSVYLINRKDPIGQIKNHVQMLPTKSSPQVIAVAGLDDDEHGYLIQQLADDR